MKIYELVDATNEETFMPLGVFSSLKELLKTLDECDEPPFDNYEDYGIAEIKEREIDKWDDGGKVVARREWYQVYNEKEDDYIWKKKDVTAKPTGELDSKDEQATSKSFDPHNNP